MIWRLTRDWEGLTEGSCISDVQYGKIYYLDKCLFEPIQDFEKKDMIEYQNETYCIENGLECILFYTPNELNRFLEKKFQNAINN